MHAFDRQTDGRTDRRTDRIPIAIPRLHSMQRGKNQGKTSVHHITQPRKSEASAVCLWRLRIIIIRVK